MLPAKMHQSSALYRPLPYHNHWSHRQIPCTSVQHQRLQPVQSTRSGCDHRQFLKVTRLWLLQRVSRLQDVILVHRGRHSRRCARRLQIYRWICSAWVEV